MFVTIFSMETQALQFGSGVERARSEPQVVEEQRNHQLERGTYKRRHSYNIHGFHRVKQSKIASNQVNCQKKDEIVNGKFISSIFFPNCEEDDTSYYSATILEFVANGAKDQTDCWFEVIPAP